jgi:hypothetical protein
MISVPMINDILEASDWDENRITREILIPCLERYSATNNHCLREIRFTGGQYELGNDIEFYELIGPDQLRLYTGIQVKKGQIGQTQATALTLQGTQAFAKEILDPAVNQNYRITRWIAATTGQITAPARQTLALLSKGENRLVHAWDGLKVAQLIFDNWLPEFLEVMKVPEQHRQSSSVTTMLYDPDDRIVVGQSLVPGLLRTLDISAALPRGVANGVILVLEPDTDKMRELMCTVQSDVADLVVDAARSRFTPLFVPMSENGTVSVRVDGDRSVTVLCRGYRYAR